MGKSLTGKELGEGISQRKNGCYQARYVDRFGNRKSIYNRDLRLLKKELHDALSNNNNHRNVIDENITLEKWFDVWLSVHKYNVIRQSTKVNYISIWQKHIKPYIGNKKLMDISYLNIKSLLNDLDKEGLGYEVQNKVRILLLDMFDKAIIDDYAVKNPAKGIKIKRDEETEPRVLTVEEQRLFFECCKGTFYDPLFIVAVSTGLRCGELAALTPSDIDFKNKEINVNKTLLYQKLEGDDGKTFHLGPPKTLSSVRTVTITRQCEAALRKQLALNSVIRNKNQRKDVPEHFKDLLFTTKYCKPINSQICIDAINNVVKEINLSRDKLNEIEPFSCHCFRHTFATRCFEADMKIKTVQKLLGHATLDMTMNLYTHVLRDTQVNEMNKLEDVLDDYLSIEENIESLPKSKVLNINKII